MPSLADLARSVAPCESDDSTAEFRQLISGTEHQVAGKVEGKMVTVTEAAAVKIKDLLEREGVPDAGLRMKVVGGGCSGLQYQLGFEDGPGEDDDTIECKGVRVFVDMKSALYLAGSELDYDDGLMGAGFRVLNPNATNQCGCGESFGV